MLRTILSASMLAVCMAAAPATRPTTRPTTAQASTTKPGAPPRVRDALLKGTVRFLVPADWALVKRNDDELTAFYKVADGKGLATMVVSPQQQPFPMGNAVMKQRAAASIMQAIAADLKKRNVELLEPPKLEPDSAFVARVVYRFKEEGHDLRAMHAYRASGFNIVSVTVSVPLADAAEAKAVHDTAATMLLSVTSGPADPKLMRPVTPE